jgi:hypothetical protein
MCAKTKAACVCRVEVGGGVWGVLRLHAGPLTHRTAGRIDALITSFSLNHRTKKTTPMVAAMRKADIIIAHHIARVCSFSESSRLIVSLHQLCQALISILGFNCSRCDRSARQVGVEKAALVETRPCAFPGNRKPKFPACTASAWGRKSSAISGNRKT